MYPRQILRAWQLILFFSHHSADPSMIRFSTKTLLSFFFFLIVGRYSRPIDYLLLPTSRRGRVNSLTIVSTVLITIRFSFCFSSLPLFLWNREFFVTSLLSLQSACFQRSHRSPAKKEANIKHDPCITSSRG